MNGPEQANLASLLQDWQQASDALWPERARAAGRAAPKPPPFYAQQVALRCWQVEDFAALQDLLQNYPAHSGHLAWQYRSSTGRALQAFANDGQLWQQVSADLNPDNPPLTAQLCAPGSSLHLQLAGDDEWACSLFLTADATAQVHALWPQPVWQQVLSQEQSHIGKHGVRKLDYEVWWRPREGGGWQAWNARLAGLEMEGEK